MASSSSSSLLLSPRVTTAVSVHETLDVVEHSCGELGTITRRDSDVTLSPSSSSVSSSVVGVRTVFRKEEILLLWAWLRRGPPHRRGGRVSSLTTPSVPSWPLSSSRRRRLCRQSSRRGRGGVGGGFKVEAEATAAEVVTRLGIIRTKSGAIQLTRKE